MARARCWNLRLNLDEFNASFAALDDDSQKAAFLNGLSRGMNGGQLRADPTEALLIGFELGQGMRQEAEEFRAKATVHGQRGGRPRNHTVNGMGDGTVNGMGAQSGTQSTIQLKNPVHEARSSVGTCTGAEDEDIPFG